MKGRKWILAKHFEGAPKTGDLKLVDFDLPAIKDGEVLLKAVSLTVDPYMRPYSATFELGVTMVGQQVAKVVESKNPKFETGNLVLNFNGWTSHSVSNGDGLVKVNFLGDLPPSLALGVLGMPGMTAYFGFTEICNPKAGETVLVNGASGAVGAVVGQIAKILGCRVIGFAGTDAKVAYLKELGFDEALNYKKITNLDETLKKAAPKGIDCFFDNVGGSFSSVVIKNMNLRGRVAVCGAISQYNSTNEEELKVPPVLVHTIGKRLLIQGLHFDDYKDKVAIGIKQHLEWMKEGKLKYREHVTNGFENMYKAFQELFTGANFGKAIINV